MKHHHITQHLQGHFEVSFLRVNLLPPHFEMSFLRTRRHLRTPSTAQFGVRAISGQCERAVSARAQRLERPRWADSAEDWACLRGSPFLDGCKGDTTRRPSALGSDPETHMELEGCPCLEGNGGNPKQHFCLPTPIFRNDPTERSALGLKQRHSPGEDHDAFVGRVEEAGGRAGGAVRCSGDWVGPDPIQPNDQVALS